MKNDIVLSGRRIPLVLIRKSIKYMYLRILPDGGIQIRANRLVPLAAIETFIRRNETKILAELDRQAQNPPPSPDVAWVFGTKVPCLRAAFPVPTVSLSDGGLRIGNFGDPVSERRAVEKAYGVLVLAETHRILEEYRKALSQDVDLSHLTFKTQRMSSQFGSCQSARRIIKLNTVLGRFDRKYLEAILLHELCHLRIHNHGNDFYRLLLQYSPDYRRLRRELNQMVKTLGA